MEELLSLKWNNHRSTFLHILGVLRDKVSCCPGVCWNIVLHEHFKLYEKKSD